MDVRIGDFLNDKLQTYADFETLDSLISNVEAQQSLLRKQLNEAESRHKDAQDASTASINKARAKAAAFERQQADIDRRLLIITQSDTADDAVQRFEPAMAHLKKLQVADQYAAMLEDVDALQDATVEALPTSPMKAVATFHDLQTLSTKLGSLQELAEGAAPHLIGHVENSVDGLRKYLRDTFAAELETVLGKILWPKETVALPGSLLEAVNTAVGKLLLLQKPEIERQADAVRSGSLNDAPAVLLALELLVEPLAARFMYHFGGDRPTNREDKPEYFVTYFFDTLNMHVEFIGEYIQPLLLEHFRDCSHKLGLAYLDATSAFITAMLPMARQKALVLFKRVSDDPQLLSHLMRELMTFDTTLREEWHYEGSVRNTSTPWKGITGDILSQDSNMDRWFAVESTFMIERYQTIISDPSNGVLNYDEVSSDTTKPSTAAVRICELFENTTQIYRTLTLLQHKLRFLIKIQCELLDLYRARLTDGLEAYLTATTTLGRNLNLHGSSSSASSATAKADAKSVQGTAGLDRLCRIIGSADYLERSLRDWSDDLFFVNFYNQLESVTQALSNGGASPSVGNVPIGDIASNTSATLGLSAEEVELGDVDPATGAIFDEPAVPYARLRARAEGELTTTLQNQVRESLKPYARTSGFVGASADDQAPTSSIAGTLALLQESFSFLARALAPLLLHQTAVATLRAADTLIFERVVLGKDYTQAGAAQLRTDLQAMVGAVERACARSGDTRIRNVGKVGVIRCFEAVRLLELIAEDTEEEEDDAWADGEANADQDADDEGQGKQARSLTHLWTVERRMFASNESARSVLADMGLLALTEQEARRILKCRVELDS